MDQKQSFTLSAQTFQRVMAYLVRQPYVQVADLIAAINAEMNRAKQDGGQHDSPEQAG